MRVLAVVHQDDAGPGVFAEAALERGSLELWHPGEELGPRLVEVDPDAVMVFGGAMNAHEEDRYPWLRREKAWLAGLLERRVPVLGVCLGSQLLAEAAGGHVRRAPQPEIGWYPVALEPVAAGDPLMAAMDTPFSSFQWHSYEAVPPSDAQALARSSICLQAYHLSGLPAWGIQFHAEVSPPTLEHWIRDYRSDADAVAMGLQPEAMLADSAPAIGAWNDLGRALCGRFLDAAAASRELHSGVM